MAGSENQRLRPYNAPPEPRQKDMAKDPRDEHEDLLSTIDDALRDGRPIDVENAQFLLDEIDRVNTRSIQNTSLGFAAGFITGAVVLAGVVSWWRKDN